MMVLLAAVVQGYGYEHRDLISREYMSSAAASSIRPGGEWFPYPEYQDREGWASLFGDAAGETVTEAERYLDYRWQPVPATAYLAFEREGDRAAMENPYYENMRALNALLLGELAEGKGRFLDRIIDGIWLSCAMPSWVLSAHLVNQPSHRPLPDPRYQIIDIGSAGYGALTAVAYHFFRDRFDAVDPAICLEIEKALKEKILDPYLDTSLRGPHWWMALQEGDDVFVNNWNPWCNSNVLLVFLLAEPDQARLEEAVGLSVKSVDRFLNYVKGDGACEEGASYWDHAYGKLYDYLQILNHATGGRFTLSGDRLLRSMGEYIPRSYIGMGYAVNFADASCRLDMDETLLYRYGKACGSSEMTDFAALMMFNPESGRFKSPAVRTGSDVWRSLGSVRCHNEMSRIADSLNAVLEHSSAEEVLRSLKSSSPEVTWYPETEVCYMENADGWFLAAKAGHNNESHNHNDVGSFILYIGGVPVFVDAGVGVYTGKTFSHERYDIWTMQSDWHNLPVINGTSQIPGKESRASEVKCDTVSRTFSADISGAYSEAASCRRWTRTYSLGDDRLVIKDNYVLDRRVMPDRIAFLVRGQVFLPGERYIPPAEGYPAKPADGSAAVTKSDLLRARTVSKGTVVIASEDILVELAFPAALAPSVETVGMSDPKLNTAWGPALRRILLTTGEGAPCRASFTYVVRLADSGR